MYLEYYGFDRKPFSKTPDPSMLFESPGHAEAMARIEQAVEDRELMLLTGEIGCGKTTLSRKIMDELPDNVKPALIINPKLSPNQLLKTIARRLGADKPRYFRGELVEQIHELLYDYYERDLLPFIIIDEAQVIPSRDSFEEIRLLTNFQLDNVNLMAVLIMGQPELSRRLKHKSYEALRQRIGIVYHLGSLDPDGVAKYVNFRLEKAGRTKPLFDAGAMKVLAELSRGIPRWINNLCAAALIEGFGRDLDGIDGSVIEDVARDIGLIDLDDEEGAGGSLDEGGSGEALQGSAG